VYRSKPRYEFVAAQTQLSVLSPSECCGKTVID